MEDSEKTETQKCMDDKTQQILVDAEEMCNCDCHGNLHVMHIMPCCAFTYQQR